MTTRFWVRGSQLRSSDFPAGTPLNHFFQWNEKSWSPDRRYVVACDLHRLLTAFGTDAAAAAKAAAHLALRPMIFARRKDQILVADEAVPLAGGDSDMIGDDAVRAAEQTVERLVASVGSSDPSVHAGVFAAFEELADKIDLDALARRRPRLKPARRRPPPRQILIIRLSALGDFVQALGPAAAIRRHHRDDRITLLTTSPLAEFAERLGLFDEVMIDRRPGPLDVIGWLALRRELRGRRFVRVYDLQTSERSAVYFQLLRRGSTPQWSGAAWRCSHPHANLDRDRQHTIDKQAEQLLMAGIYPTPLPALASLDRELPHGLAGRRFVLMVPGSSARHLAKRWPARRYAMLAKALLREGCASVVIGSGAERPLGAAVRELCPEAVDLVGRTDIESVAALAQRAMLTVGNDTGVTHLAAAAGSPVVVLFSRASDPAWCAPRGRKVEVLTAPSLDELEIDQVLAAAVRVIAEGSTPTEDTARHDIASKAGVG